MKWNDESKKAFVQALNIEFLTTTSNYTNFQFIKTKNCQDKDQVCMLFPVLKNEEEECKEYLEKITTKYRNIVELSRSGIIDFDSFPFCISSDKFRYSKSNEAIKFEMRLDNKIINNLYFIFINQILLFKFNAKDEQCNLCLSESEKKMGYISGWAFPKNDKSEMQKKQIVKRLFEQYHFQLEEENVTDPYLGQYCCVYIREFRADKAVQRAIKDFPIGLFRKYPKSLHILFSIFYNNLIHKKKISQECKQFIKGTWDECMYTIGDNVASFSYRGDDDDKKKALKAVKEIEKLYEGTSGITFSKFIDVNREGNNIKVSFTFDLHNINIIMKRIPCMSSKKSISNFIMEFRELSKEGKEELIQVLVQALNIKFLTAAQSYTNFQLVAKKNTPYGEFYMLFSSKDRKECRGYLEEVTEKMRKENIQFDLFASMKFHSGGHGEKLMICLDEQVIGDLHNSLNEITMDKEGKIITNSGAIKNSSIQLLIDNPKSLFMLLYIFCRYKAELCDLEKNIKTAKADGNVVSFYCCAEDISKVRNYKKMIDEDKDNEDFKDFIKLSEENENTFKVSFTFNFHNVGVILKIVPCNMANVKKARKLFCEQVIATVSSDAVATSSSAWSSTPSQKSDQSDDSVLEASSADPNHISIDCTLGTSVLDYDYESKPNSPTEMLSNTKVKQTNLSKITTHNFR